MSQRHPGGIVHQAALRPGSGAGTAVTAVIEGVVVGIHYPEDVDNRSKVEIEYDVDPVSVFGMQRLRNVPRSNLFSGVDDGDEHILRVAQERVNGESVESTTPRYETNGDRVLVCFVNGDVHRPVIVGVLTHFKSRMKSTKDAAGKALPRKGALYRRTRHRGTETLWDEKGNVTLTVGKTPDKTGQPTDDKKVLSIVIGDFTVSIDNTSSPTTLHVKGPNNDVLKLTKDGLELGESPSDFAALASLVKTELSNLQSSLSSLVTAYNAHFHAGTAGPVPVVTTPTVAQALPPSPVNDVKSSFTKTK